MKPGNADNECSEKGNGKKQLAHSVSKSSERLESQAMQVQKGVGDCSCFFRPA